LGDHRGPDDGSVGTIGGKTGQETTEARGAAIEGRGGETVGETAGDASGCDFVPDYKGEEETE